MDEIGRKASTETGTWTVGTIERVAGCGFANASLGERSFHECCE